MNGERDKLGPELRLQIGRRIRTIRGTVALEDIAERIHMSAGTLGKLERGGSDPQLGTLLALVRVLEVSSIEELLGELPEPPSAGMAREIVL